MVISLIYSFKTQNGTQVGESGSISLYGKDYGPLIYGFFQNPYDCVWIIKPFSDSNCEYIDIVSTKMNLNDGDEGVYGFKIVFFLLNQKTPRKPAYVFFGC